ncbi:MMPL family transporter [Streptomyces sp. SID3343]|uniref:MMPL family transporter n=1 Tax=Streptomyces sp. SID3343 TaxID=2690260 RepID=UPI0013706968|nr:MMPL family transporter [Streptomyces sp. SID3343]
MLERLGDFVFRRARAVLVVGGLLLLVAAGVGFGAFGKLQSEGFDAPDSASSRAKETIEDTFPGRPNIVFEVRAKDGSTVDGPAVAAAGRTFTEALSGSPGFDHVASYWTTGAPGLKADDGHGALVVAHAAEDEVSALPKGAEPPADSPIKVRIGGENAIGPAVSGEVGKSLALAEAIAVPLTLLLLVLAFGSVIAALIPLAIGFIAIMGTFAELFVLGSLTDVSIFSINLTTALGLGLAIDYALLIVARHRELLRSGHDLHDAVVGTLRTAGRTILFSAATVAAALAVLLVFPQYFLRSFAYAGIGVVIISALAALIIAPALLTVLGPRVDSLRVRGIKGVQGAEAPMWSKLAGLVSRRPALTALPVLAALLLAASPLLGVQFGTPDERVLPTATDVRQVGDTMREDYSHNDTRSIDVVLLGSGAEAPVDGYAAALGALPGVTRVDSAAADSVRPGARLLTVITTLPAKSDAAQDLVHDVRAVPAPDRTEALVGGTDAALVDTKSSIADRLPLAFGLIVLSTFVLLFLFTGSVLQPLRALLLNGISITAAVGVTVWVFQDGHLSGWLGFTPLPMDTSMTVLLFCIAFALSMDYEVFVTSRIKELHDAGESDADAVRHGLGRTGRIVTTAAALLAVTFVAFLTSSVSFLQLFGFGAALAILLDATLVRGVLVPAAMRVLGRYAWYAPAPLRRLHERVGLRESAPESVDLPAHRAPAEAAESEVSAHKG